MLRDRYQNDKIFDEVIRLLPKMRAELAEIDRILADNELLQLVHRDLAHRRPKSLVTGRKSTPTEVILRMLSIKWLYGWSYEETERNVSDSLVLRQFCRIHFERVPDDTTLIRCANAVSPETLAVANQRLTQLALQLGITKGRQLRTDGTVVESNIHAPSDNRLLADGVRVLARTIERARQVLQKQGQALEGGFENFSQTAKQKSRQIGQGLRQRTEKSLATGRQAYQELIAITEQTLNYAQQTLAQMPEQAGQGVKRLANTLQTFIPRVEQVVNQTQRRIFQQESVPASEKLVSIFEAHADIIVRNKENKPVEYGHKIWLNEVDGGVISHYWVLEGNPGEPGRWPVSLQAHRQCFGRPPELASADRGLYSAANEQFASAFGVEKVVLPYRGQRSNKRLEYEHQEWFIQGRNWQAGVEGRISLLKRQYGLSRCLNHGWIGFKRWVGWGIFAANLDTIGCTLSSKRPRQRDYLADGRAKQAA